MSIVIRPMVESDLPEASRIFNESFAAFLKIPEKMMRNSTLIAHRFKADASRCFVAEFEGELVGSNLSTHWGTMAFFGPITTRQKGWTGDASKLLNQRNIDLAKERGATFFGGFTHAGSPQHARFFHEFRFMPRFLIMAMGKPVSPKNPKPWLPEWRRLSEVPEAERAAVLAECFEISDSLYPGLDVRGDIETTLRLGFGDVVLLYEGSKLASYVFGYFGPGTEAPTGTFYVRFAATRSGPGAPERFERMLDACESFAALQKLSSISASVNLARTEAYLTLLGRGYFPLQQGISLHMDNKEATGRPGLWILDDWR